jgi:hypothetical protein
MIALKSGVKLVGLVPQMAVVLVVASSLVDEMERDLIITSANDSNHMNGSKHYSGEALDFRVHDWAADSKDRFVNRLRGALGSDFDVVLESLGLSNEHLHVEWDPK